MLSSLMNAARSGLNALSAVLPLGIKGFKYFIDSTFRQRVIPVPGSVLYCDLWVGVEHSGIYVDNGAISNIVVTDFAESEVRYSQADDFTSKSVLGKKIYVSCDSHGSVGDARVAGIADARIGERSFYGLVISNCHVFSTECVCHAVARPKDNGVLDKLWQTASGLNPFNETWELTLTRLKLCARENLGATKWRLWDWEDSAEDNPTPEPDWEAQQDALRRMPLTAEAIQALQHEREEQQAYYQEISDESIPDDIRRKLNDYGVLLEEIIDVYNGAKSFLAACPGASFSYEDLKRNQADLLPLANQMQGNAQIKELVRKMGRAYISEEKKAMLRVPQASRSEVHGTHRSDDLMRLLPSELVNLDDETLEHLFYARLLEKNLLSYELSGTTFIQQEVTEQVDQKITGPVVACLDTSGSMNGEPELKAKALLLAISGILQTEKRNLHVILFGSSGELKEFTAEQKNDAAGLLAFLQQGFGGGTDFETPLQRACEHIQQYDDYLKADVLMISDGDCQLSQDYLSQLQQQKQQLDFSIYSVLCNGQRVDDSFSDEIVVL